MPIVTLKMAQKRGRRVDIGKLTNHVRIAISHTPKLEVEEDDVSVFVPYDLTVQDKVIAEVLLYDKPFRTGSVIKEMSSHLRRMLKDMYFPDVSVGVVVVVVNPDHCVSSHG